jgi:aminoglycoside phosphotransferase (APT) family kinase protein
MAELESDLARAVERHLGGVRSIAGLRRLAAGATQETWSFDAERDGECERLILRRSAKGMERGESDVRLTIEGEARVLQIAREHGVPVPAVRFVLDADDELGQGFVMERIDGESVPRRILRDVEYAAVRPLLARQCGEALARIHALPLAALPGLPHAPARDQLARPRRNIDDGANPEPVLEYALRWLAERTPAEVPPRVLHGDYRNGNLIVGPEGLRAVLDWETAHAGDPAEDFGWFCANVWRFGEIDKRAGGFGTLDEMLEGYVAGGGESIDPERVLWWEVLASLKWASGCILMQRIFERGADRSVERALIGRRVSENEVDLLRSIAPRRAR